MRTLIVTCCLLLLSAQPVVAAHHLDPETAVDHEWLEGQNEFTKFAFNPFRDIDRPVISLLKYRTLRKFIGDAQKVTQHEIFQPRWEGDFAWLLHYDGFCMGIVANVANKDALGATRMDIVGNGHPLKYDLKIGKTTRAQIITRFEGADLYKEVWTKPTDKNPLFYDGPLFYKALRVEFVGEPSPSNRPRYQTVEFHFDDHDLLQRIRISVAGVLPDILGPAL